MLLRNRADPNSSCGGDYPTPLHWAAMSGCNEVIKLLVERGSYVNMKDSSFQITPLYAAVEKGVLECVNFLLFIVLILMKKGGECHFIVQSRIGS